MELIYLKPIILLDMDGVLNNHSAFELALAGQYPPGNITMMTVCKNCVQLFKELIIESKADIVLTSSWRAHRMDHPNWINLSGNGLVINALSWASFEAKEYFIGNTPNHELDLDNRGMEIDHWFNTHPERYIKGVTPYVILDDDTDFTPEQMLHLVNTDEKLGLTGEDVKKALEILKCT